MPRFDDIPLIDNHLHPPLTALAAAGRVFADFFSEADDADLLAQHVTHSRFFRRALRDLAALLGCGTDEHDVVAARAALGPAGLLRLCVERGNVRALVVDDGYPRGSDALSVAEMGAAAGCVAVRVLRLETAVESAAAETDDLNRFDSALVRFLDEAYSGGLVALKSIIAYRCGLAFRTQPRQEAAAGLQHEHQRLRAGQNRVADPRLLYHALALGLDWAGERGLPVQIHTGFGDRDLDLTQANPALLRHLLEDGRFARNRLVLLHASYPYTRAAGYLAAVYANVYVDWSEANPLLAGPELVRVLEELLALAPVTKLLYGSDAWGIPDWICLGARYGREALAAALADDPDADACARRILHDNAAALYGLN